MDSSVMSRGNRSHSKLRTACIVAIALIVVPVLTGQQEDPAQIRMRAMALENQGQNAEAEQIWDGIAKADPRDAEALAHLGLLEARQEHYETAIDYYRRAVAINTDLPGLQMNLGLALFKVAQFPAAIEAFSSEIRKHPGDLRLTILLGMAHYGMKDYLVAIPYLQRATERDAQNIPLRMTLAHSCMWSKQYQCVLKVHEQILALKGESAEIDTLAGEAFDQMGDSAAAEKQFRAAVLINPTEPNVHFGLGYLLWTQRRWSEAAREFQSELENNRQHVMSRIYLADAWVRQGEFAKARPALEELASGDQSEPLVHRDLGILYANAGQNDDALREFAAAMKSDPGDAETYLQIAKLFQTIGKRDEANAAVDKAGSLPSRRPASLQEMIDSIETPAPR
jgi:tetratricopeptide (TPR) repeat protein